MSQVFAPFTSQQVAKLEEWQRSRFVHPFTCPNRTRETHRERYGDLGALVPETSGWHCPDCGYRQQWCHDFMLNGEPENLLRFSDLKAFLTTGRDAAPQAHPESTGGSSSPRGCGPDGVAPDPERAKNG